MRCVGAIIRDTEGRLLLIQRGHPPSEGLWSLPGGRVEEEETDTDALRREIREETGLEIEVGALAGSVVIGFYEIFDYYAHVTGGDLTPGDDAAAATWATANDLVRLPLTKGLLDFLGDLS
ncbi:NUDIX domain-containing protein [Herbidospora mongoliensis]|uniref:NUDIX domain-containing protein n=1 Tax=Herbidospora mongoliensis TaxID=688067 RepID=UPI000834FB7F|nr:NUDIX domain-containing protein [Herbidospora mongoliensis]